MKKILTFCALLTAHLCFGQTEKAATDSTKFNKYLSENKQSFTFDGQKPIGEGWVSLENLFAENQFVGWGRIP